MIVVQGYHYIRDARFSCEHKAYTVPLIHVAEKIVISALLRAQWNYGQFRDKQIVWGSPEPIRSSLWDRWMRARPDAVTWKFSQCGEFVDANIQFYFRRTKWSSKANSERISRLVNEHLSHVVEKAEEVSVCYTLL